MSRRGAILAVAWLSISLCSVIHSAAGIAAKSAMLERGTFGPDIWTVSTHRSAYGADARIRPCLDILIAQRIYTSYEASKFEACGGVTSTPTLINFSAGSGKKERTVIAMALGAKVQRVLVDLGSRGMRRMRPRLLPRVTAKELGLERFRFAVIALAGPHCLRRVLGTEGDGAVAFDKRFRNCAT